MLKKVYNENLLIPQGAFNIHIFAIKEVNFNSDVFDAFIGYNTPNGDFHYIQVPVETNLLKDLIQFKNGII